DAYGHTRQGKADRARTSLAVVRVAEVHERLGHAVALQDGVAEEIAKAFEDMDGQRCRSGDEEPHAVADLARDGRRSLEQANVHGRNTEEERRLEIEKLF